MQRYVAASPMLTVDVVMELSEVSPAKEVKVRFPEETVSRHNPTFVATSSSKEPRIVAKCDTIRGRAHT